MARADRRLRTACLRNRRLVRIRLTAPSKPIDRRVYHNVARNWLAKAIEDLPDNRAFAIACMHEHHALRALSPYRDSPTTARLRQIVYGRKADIRHLEAFDIARKATDSFGDWRNRTLRQIVKGDFLRQILSSGYYGGDDLLDDLPGEAVWPYIAENLAVLDEALGLRPVMDRVEYSRVYTVRALARLPAVPARYLTPLMDIATGATKSGRAEARQLLAGVDGIDERLVNLLGDSRQAVRAAAAEWLADRQSAVAVKAIRARLKKEKSELARAAMLTALDRMGEDLSDYLGPAALLKEAEKGLKSAKFDKLDWLGLDNLPGLRLKSGKTLSPDVPRYWIYLANKLKQPGGNALFRLYLDQLNAEDAVGFSTWILDSWMTYDTKTASLDVANAYAEQHAQQRFQQYQHWYPDITMERIVLQLKAEILSNYLNSGAAFKGLLGLAVKAAPTMAADRVRAYLKNHGARTSQAASLLEFLAGIDDPVALQVVIAASTRLKQKSVQRRAGELVRMVADQNSWTLDELSDRTIPTAGFNEEGVLELPTGTDGEKVYTAVLDDDFKIVLRNPAGKTVSALPAGEDENSKASKKALSTAKKEIRQVVRMQSERLYEALCSERVWTNDDWQNCFATHPVMHRLIAHVVWAGCDGEGTITGSFRPTAEGDYTNAQDEDADPMAFSHIRIAHGALMDEVTSNAWEAHLEDYEIKPLFTQFGRSLLSTASEGMDGNLTRVEDRKGWITDTFSVRGAASKLGYDRGETLDGGFFNEYIKTFPGAGLAAVIEFSGNCLPEENVPASVFSLTFQSLNKRSRGGARKLKDVPGILLSECWNDYRTFAGSAGFDADWERKMPW